MFQIRSIRQILTMNLVNHGSNDIAANEPAASWAACMERCSAISNCVRAIFDHNANLCYLRSFGNTDDPVETGVWDSAHLVEDPKPELLSESPKTCPEAEGKQVRLGGVDYQMFCTNGYSANLPMLAYPSATDVNDCLAQCCKFTSIYSTQIFLQKFYPQTQRTDFHIHQLPNRNAKVQISGLTVILAS